MNFTHTILLIEWWHCQYYIVWVPKYRYKVLRRKIAEEVRTTIIIQSERLDGEDVELNIQSDYVHLLIKVPPRNIITNGSNEKENQRSDCFLRFPELK